MWPAFRSADQPRFVSGRYFETKTRGRSPVHRGETQTRSTKTASRKLYVSMEGLSWHWVERSRPAKLTRHQNLRLSHQNLRLPYQNLRLPQSLRLPHPTGSNPPQLTLHHICDSHPTDEGAGKTRAAEASAHVRPVLARNGSHPWHVITTPAYNPSPLLRNWAVR